jgi:hypothetical protein
VFGGNPNACNYCQKALFGQYKIGVESLQLHPQCFLCAGCNKQIKDKYVKVGSLPNQLKFYHSTCLNELCVPSCDLCDNKLRDLYKVHGFFKNKQKYCFSHDSKELSARQCASCQLVVPLKGSKGRRGRGGEVFDKLPDGRVICSYCLPSVIIDSKEAQQLYLEAVSFMEHVLDLHIPAHMREVPVMAVEPSVFNNLGLLNEHQCNDRSLPSGSAGIISNISTL